MSEADANVECERLRKLAHEAPLNKVFQDHTGHRFLGTHSMAWASASRAWMEAKQRLDGSPETSTSTSDTIKNSIAGETL